MSLPLLGSSKSLLAGSGYKPRGLAVPIERLSEKRSSIRVADLIAAVQRTIEGMTEEDFRQARSSFIVTLFFLVGISLSVNF